MGLKTPFARGNPKSYKPCSHRAAEAPLPCLDCRSETRTRRKFRLKLVLCLFWPFVLQALDSTMYVSASVAAYKKLQLSRSNAQANIRGLQHRQRYALDRRRLQPLQPAKLDRILLQPDLVCLHPLLGAGRRRLWPLPCVDLRHGSHDHW